LFEDVRDHVLIRLLCEGLRRTEIVQMRLDDLPADLVLQPLVRVVPLKGAHAEDAGRLVPLASATAAAMSSYQRVRRYHRQRRHCAAVAPAAQPRADERLGAVPDAPAPRRAGGV
jgi:site-specific recombinase XerD